METLIAQSAIAFAAGMILNLMPCVLPVMPFKVQALLRETDRHGSIADDGRCGAARRQPGLFYRAGCGYRRVRIDVGPAVSAPLVPAPVVPFSVCRGVRHFHRLVLAAAPVRLPGAHEPSHGCLFHRRPGRRSVHPLFGALPGIGAGLYRHPVSTGSHGHLRRHRHRSGVSLCGAAALARASGPAVIFQPGGRPLSKPSWFRPAGRRALFCFRDFCPPCFGRPAGWVWCWGPASGWCSFSPAVHGRSCGPF
jgi:hypothetical protein